MLEIQLLGSFAVSLDGRPVELRGRVARDLLAWLALHPGRHGRLRAAGVLWPDLSEAAARNNLRQAVWTLRRDLGDGDWLISTRQEIGVDPDTTTVDLLRRLRLLESGEISRALELDGELLPDRYDDWAEEARAEHGRAWCAALDRAGWRAEESSDLVTAITLSQRLVTLDPYSEQAHRELIRRLAASGDRARALQVYERLRVRLRDELGVAPAAETTQLATRLRAAATLDVGAAAAFAAVEHRLVARRAEMRTLRSAWASVRSGRGRCVAVVGEPGAGKTRLVEEVARLTSGEGALVLFGRATAETLVPYQPWVEAVRRCALAMPEGPLANAVTPGVADLVAIVPEIAARLPASNRWKTSASNDRFRLFEAVVEFVANLSMQLPVVVVLDDMHWADASTRLLLTYFVDGTAELPVLTLVTYRDTDPGTRSVDAALTDARGQRVTRLVLSGLARADVAELASISLGASPGDDVIDVLHRRTAGNPFFVLEVLRHRGATADFDVPDAVAQIVDRRIDHLGHDVRRLLEIAAVIGFDFAADVLAVVSGTDVDDLLDALDGVVQARILEELPGAPGRYRFVHPLGWEALYSGLSESRRARLHERVGDALDARPAPRPVDAVVEIARHFLRAPQATRTRTARFVLRAIDATMAARAFDEVVALCDDALVVLGDGDRELRQAIFTRRGLAVGTLIAEDWHPGLTAVVRSAYAPATQEK